MTDAPDWINPVNDRKTPYAKKPVKRFFYCSLFLLLIILLLTIFTAHYFTSNYFYYSAIYYFR